MKQFNIFTDRFGSLTAERVGKSVSGSTKVCTVSAISKGKAIDIAKARAKSGLITLPTVSKPRTTRRHIEVSSLQEGETRKAIFCDFNGVLNDPEKYSNEFHPSFKLPQETCPHKMVRLLKLALKHNAEIVMTSLWRLEGIGYDVIAGRCLLHCGIDEYVDFYNDNRREIKRLTRVMPTGNGSSRDNEIAESIELNEYTHYVVFEDEHQIRDDFNVLMTDPWTGLTDKHIELADAKLSDEIASSEAA